MEQRQIAVRVMASCHPSGIAHPKYLQEAHWLILLTSCLHNLKCKTITHQDINLDFTTKAVLIMLLWPSWNWLTHSSPGCQLEFHYPAVLLMLPLQNWLMHSLDLQTNHSLVISLWLVSHPNWQCQAAGWWLYLDFVLETSELLLGHTIHISKRLSLITTRCTRCWWSMSFSAIFFSI